MVNDSNNGQYTAQLSTHLIFCMSVKWFKKVALLKRKLDNLVEICHSGEPSDDRIEKKDWVSIKNTTFTRKELNAHLHVNCTCAMPQEEKGRRRWNQLVSRLLQTLSPRYVCDCFYELLGSTTLSTCLVWGFVASLAIILLLHQNGQLEISSTIPK